MAQVHKITVLGDGAVGKTALTIQFCSNHFVEYYDPTIESSYRRQIVIDQRACVLDILDTAGQDDYTALRSQWIRSGEGFIIIYDTTNLNSVVQAELYYNEILRCKDSDGITNRPPIVLCGNKSDLVESRKVSIQMGKDLAKQFNCKFFETSAKTRSNIDESFYELVREIRKLIYCDTIGTSETADKKKKKLPAGCTLL